MGETEEFGALLDVQDIPDVPEIGDLIVGAKLTDAGIFALRAPSNCAYSIFPGDSKIKFLPRPTPFDYLEGECGGEFTLTDVDDFVTQCQLYDPDLEPKDWLHYGTALAWQGKFKKAHEILEKALGKAKSIGEKALLEAVKENLRLVKIAGGQLSVGNFKAFSTENVELKIKEAWEGRISGVQLYTD